MSTVNESDADPSAVQLQVRAEKLAEVDALLAGLRTMSWQSRGHDA